MSFWSRRRMDRAQKAQAKLHLPVSSILTDLGAGRTAARYSGEISVIASIRSVMLI